METDKRIEEKIESMYRSYSVHEDLKQVLRLAIEFGESIVKAVEKDYDYKKKCRKEAIAIETLAIPAAGSKDPTFVAMMDLANMVMHLTADVSINTDSNPY